ncbi:TPM domain-containing protein [Porphyromonas levii]|uniref:TPM domain-containing protein n=1 Tax=Porphyromonas levii TaxID=28114 RepID=A0A4Y8WQ00_9PORP|nr:TPM domain-containing protein [Porphyromonas levii]MBR8702993.1 hypothetical protein [Porphyromonas levii]MBR8759842.1 hypothetical protein [Porphyromonas levii]MBR8764370.1 hypothetical protein [Porphyromonas levii]TFH94430.1 TPM domain-containing protein [Porphyromonas levii]TFH95656.1 TPM domain-containing protein [Porphyromonas levii]
MHRHIALLLLCLLSLAGNAREYTPSEVPNVQLQDARQFVSDPEGHFTAEELVQLNAALYNIREQHTAEVALVVLPGIENDDPERFTVKLFEAWGIGKAVDDNGLLILYKYGEAGQRIVRFEVGYGLEGVLPDITTKRLTDHFIVPAIVEGRDAEGFLQTFSEIDNLLTEGYVAQGENQDYSRGNSGNELREMGFAYLIFALFVGLLYGAGLVTLWRRAKEPAEQEGVLFRRYKNQWWLIFILPALLFLYPLYLILKSRTQKHITNCPSCHTKGSVRLLRKPDNYPYLNSAQRAEEQVGSVSYPVYSCSVCGYHKVVEQPALLTSYQRCTRCGAKTYFMKDQTQDSRFLTQTFTCLHCGKSDIRRTRISGGSSGGFGGGFGGSGGGFGGGFGGGMSGGGGSTTRF